MATVNNMILEAAKAETGTWEWAGAEHNPVVLDYYAKSGHPEIGNDEVPWCAAFVGAVLAKCGLPNTGSLLARSYSAYGESVTLAEAQPGDIVVLPRGKDWQGHVGFFVKYNNGKLRLLAGNQGNQVNEKDYAIEVASTDIVAIRRAKAPRASMAQSKTSVIAVAKTVLAGSGVAVTAATQMDWRVQMALIAAFVLIGVGALFIFKERADAWFQKGNR